MALDMGFSRFEGTQKYGIDSGYFLFLLLTPFLLMKPQGQFTSQYTHICTDNPVYAVLTLFLYEGDS